MQKKLVALLVSILTLAAITPVSSFAVGRDGTPIGPPLAVTIDGTPSASDTSTTFTDVNWKLLSAGTEDGGSPIIGYNVTAYLSSDTSTAITSCTAGPAATTCQLTGLNFARTYVVRVYATNAIGNSPYSWSSSFTTNSQSQTVEITGMPASMKFTDPSFQLTGTATSGLPVTWSSTTTSVCTVSTLGVVSIVGTGTCTIKATQSGAGSTYASANSTASGTVTADVTATATGATTVQGTSAVLNGQVPYPGVTVTPTFCLSLTDSKESCSNPSGTTIGTLSPSTITASSSTSFKATASGLSSSTIYFYWVEVDYSGTTYKSSTSTFTTQNVTPTITYSGTTTLTLGDDLSGTATATGGSGTYDKWEFSTLPDGVTSSSSDATLTLSGKPTAVGTYSVTITVTDSDGKIASKEISITVNAKAETPSTPTTPTTPTSNSNSSGGGGGGAPSLPSLPSQTIDLPKYTSPIINGGTPQNLATTASSGLPVTYKSESPDICSINEKGLVTFLSSGKCLITFSQDGGGNWTAATASLTITVLPKLTIEVLEPTNLQSTRATLNVRAFSSDPGAKVEICLSKSEDSPTCPPAYPAKLGAISPTLLDPGIFTVFSLQATELNPASDYYVWARITLDDNMTRAESRLIHTPVGPAITVDGPVEITLGEELKLNFGVNGGSSPYKNWIITGLPTGSSSQVNGSSGSISGAPTRSGVYTIRIRVQDAENLTAQVAINVTVKNPSAVTRNVKDSTLQVIGPNLARVSWTPDQNFTHYQVKLEQKIACDTTGSSCDLKQLLGPKASISITGITSQGLQSNPVAPVYIPPKSPIVISLAHFASSSSVLSAQDKAMLTKLASVLVAQGFSTIQVIGHTDNQGSDKTSAPLSLARAQSTYKVLKQIFGKLPVSVAIVAKGSGSPVQSNATSGGRAANRRAEVLLK